MKVKLVMVVVARVGSKCMVEAIIHIPGNHVLYPNP